MRDHVEAHGVEALRRRRRGKEVRALVFDASPGFVYSNRRMKHEVHRINDRESKGNVLDLKCQKLPFVDKPGASQRKKEL